MACPTNLGYPDRPRPPPPPLATRRVFPGSVTRPLSAPSWSPRLLVSVHDPCKHRAPCFRNFRENASHGRSGSCRQIKAAEPRHGAGWFQRNKEKSRGVSFRDRAAFVRNLLIKRRATGSQPVPCQQAPGLTGWLAGCDSSNLPIAVLSTGSDRYRSSTGLRVRHGSAVRPVNKTVYR